MALLVFANAFFVAAEFALISLRRSRIEQMAAEGSRFGKMLLRAKDEPNRFISAAQLGITMASLALGWIGESTIAALVDPPLEQLLGQFAPAAAHGVAIATSFVIITMLHIVLGEQVPKMVALQHSERTAIYTVGTTEAFFRLFRPFIALFTWTTDLVLAALRIRPQSEHEAAVTSDELELLVQTSHRAGVLQDTERDLLSNVFDFADLAVHQVMIPRPDIAGVPAEVSLDELVELGERSPHSRFPVYEGSLDNIIGIVHVKDLLRAAHHRADQFELRRVLRPPLFVPETMPAGRLLAEFRRAHTTLAVVIDEYGGTAGLVTIDDLIQEIVGDVPDEFHAETPSVDAQPDGTTLVSPRLRLDEFDDLFHLRLDEVQEAETVGGLVVERLGRLAETGDVIDLGGHQLLVEEIDGVKITCLRMIPGRRADVASDSDAES